MRLRLFRNKRPRGHPAILGRLRCSTKGCQGREELQKHGKVLCAGRGIRQEETRRSSMRCQKKWLFSEEKHGPEDVQVDTQDELRRWRRHEFSYSTSSTTATIRELWDFVQLVQSRPPYSRAPHRRRGGPPCGIASPRNGKRSSSQRNLLRSSAPSSFSSYLPGTFDERCSRSRSIYHRTATELRHELRSRYQVNLELSFRFRHPGQSFSLPKPYYFALDFLFNTDIIKQPPKPKKERLADHSLRICGFHPAHVFNLAAHVVFSIAANVAALCILSYFLGPQQSEIPKPSGLKIEALRDRFRVPRL
jgi:hypothetical protein